MTDDLRPWVRTLLAADGALREVGQLSEIARDAIVQLAVPAERRSSVSFACYERSRGYGPDDQRFQAGLFPWEMRAFATAPFPRQGLLLVGGCGGGREVEALAALGHDVVAFDPVPRLTAIARSHLEGPRVQILDASYDDLVAHREASARGRRGAAVVEALAGRPVAGVVLGWGSFSQVFDEGDRARLLVTLRALAPDAPVLVSFVPRSQGSRGPRAERAARRIERLATRLGRPLAHDLGFSESEGFYVELDPASVAATAAPAGYRLGPSGTFPYGHALLVPEGAVPASTGAPPTTPPTPRRLPRAAAATVRFDTVVQKLARGFALVRDEAFASFLGAPERRALTDVAYSRNDAYVPGGHAFEAGLFEWEEELLTHPLLPRNGRVLVTAAGGGREALAFGRLGYDVVACEPCAPLFTALEAQAQTHDRLTALRGDYSDLVAAAQGRGTLAEPLRASRPDLVLLGWGSLCHLDDKDAMVEVLRSVRALAPKAPVMASFFLPVSASRRAPSTIVRRAARAAFALVGGKRDPALFYYPEGGFLSLVSEGELAAMAATAGYAMPFVSTSSQPCCILVPLPERTTHSIGNFANYDTMPHRPAAMNA